MMPITMILPFAILLLSPAPTPDPIILACSPPPAMCATLEADCVTAGVDPHRCLELAQGVCPSSKCLACSRAVDACAQAGGDCDALQQHCDDALLGCSCEPHCADTTTLNPDELVAACYAWPLSLGQCDDPSAGQCMTTLPWVGCKGLTTCEYFECMEDIELFGTCEENIPPSCAEVVACIKAEAGGDVPTRLPLTSGSRR